ncbi:MAG: phosphate ABC transporter substrate-binding protein PstS [Candidatus Margulisiibacteriota bacterium]|nr:phosphate ABC transporter substrate-binding protein PstS [Candidatus Margulisiibacteriota bacterium]
MLKKLIVLSVAAMLMIGAASAAVLNGAGATFPYPIYMKWNKIFSQKTGIKVNYQGIGSGGGIRQFTVGITDYGGSDAPMTDKQIAKACKNGGESVYHIPTVMGAVAIAYNLPGIDLRLDLETMVDIFMGKIKKWDDPAIAELNPNEDLPNKNITVVHRSDGSGTTSIFTTYMARSMKWAAEVGKGKAVAWPAGLGGKGNAGVAGLISTNPGAIGYAELSYAIKNDLPVIALKNKAGKFIKPTIDSTSAAAAGALKSKKLKKMVNAGDFRLNLTNAPGDRSYPIVGMTWLLVHKVQKNPAKGKLLVKYLNWILTDGQKYASELLYAPLPKPVREKVLDVVGNIET